MKFKLFSYLSKFNKNVLPKMWEKADLSNLSTTQKLIIGWKRWVTLNYISERDKINPNPPKGGVY